MQIAFLNWIYPGICVTVCVRMHVCACMCVCLNCLAGVVSLWQDIIIQRGSIIHQEA